ncbi:MAG TPA: hypothetical protein VGM27_08570 [Acidobacteriaceae bacterium]
MEPTVRTGALSTIPEEAIPTTLRKPGNIYLAQAQTYSGNSGSPMFVSTVKTEGTEPQYLFFGVLSGQVQESADLSLQTTVDNKVNSSGVSVVTPPTRSRNSCSLPHSKRRGICR